MASTMKEKEIQTDWPVEKGLTAGTQSQIGRQENLLPQGLLGLKTNVPVKDREGIDG